MIGDGERGKHRGFGQIQCRQILGYIFRHRRYPSRLLGIGGIEPEHMAVILDRRTAARCRDNDRFDIGRKPGIDRAPGAGESILLPAHMMGE